MFLAYGQAAGIQRKEKRAQKSMINGQKFELDSGSFNLRPELSLKSSAALSSRALANVVGLHSSTCTLANEARQRASVQEARAAGPQ